MIKLDNDEICLSEDLRAEVFYGDHPDYKLIEDGDWEDGGKYSFAENIIEYKGIYYSMWASRSGSYFTDYDYEYSDELVPVKKIEVVKHKWVDDENADS